MRNRILAGLLLGMVLLVPPMSAPASPLNIPASPSTAPKCSMPEYRQAHLQECNRGGNPGVGVGAGGGGGGGLLGAISRLVGSIL